MDYSADITDHEISESFLTEAEASDVRKPLAQASIMPLLVYANRAYHEREVEAALRPGWHALAHIDELRETGSFVAGEIVGEPIVVVRDKSGVIRALSNVCRHRGSRLVNGCGVAKLLACPFHAWMYNLDGTLRGAPHMNGVEGFSRAEVRLPEFRTEIWNGFVFVTLDDDAEPLGPRMADLSEKIAAFQFDRWEVFPWKEASADWNWKISMENFTEAYHHVAVHKDSIGAISKAEDAIYEDTDDSYSVFYVKVDPPEDMAHKDGAEFLPDQGDRPFPAFPGLPEFFQKYSPVVNIYPTFHIVVGPNFVLWLRFEITGAESHRLIWKWLVPPGARELPDVAERLQELDQIMSQVVSEDLAFMPNIKRSLGSRAFAPGRYSLQEKAVHQMHRYLLQRLGTIGGVTAPGAGSSV